MSYFSIENLVVVFGGLRALSNVSLSLGKGEIHGLIGPNGAGKTTLINAVSGLIPQTSGRVADRRTTDRKSAGSPQGGVRHRPDLSAR